MNLRVKKELDKESINIYHKIFNDYNKCNWTLEQFKQSLRNQDYLKHLVFYKDNKIIGITEYSINNPWNKITNEVIYSIDNITKEYIEKYTQEIINKEV